MYCPLNTNTVEDCYGYKDRHCSEMSRTAREYLQNYYEKHNKNLLRLNQKVQFSVPKWLKVYGQVYTFKENYRNEIYGWQHLTYTARIMDVTCCYSPATYIILEDTTGITLGPGYQYIYEKLSIEKKFLL